MATFLAGIVLGLALLTGGAELLVQGAASLAERLGMSRLVVGLTIVAFGTSAPELTVSISAALRDQPDLALGNVVGSNIFNVLLILGLSALVTPLAVSRPLLRVDIPAMIATSVVLWWQVLDGSVSRGDGAVLLLLMAAYLVRIFRAEGAVEAVPNPGGTLVKDGLRIVGGLALLVFGTQVFVDSAAGIARVLGVSELVIGLTIVAAGTSLPETATSVLAAWRGERDIAVGNIVGSNLFNVLLVLGASAAVAAKGIAASPEAVAFDIPVMVAVAVACLPAALSGATIDRREGGLFLLTYVGYVTYLVLRARGHQALPGVGWLVTFLLAPLAVMTLVDLRHRRGGGGLDSRAAEG